MYCAAKLWKWVPSEKSTIQLVRARWRKSGRRFPCEVGIEEAATRVCENSMGLFLAAYSSAVQKIYRLRRDQGVWLSVSLHPLLNNLFGLLRNRQDRGRCFGLKVAHHLAEWNADMISII